jgi:hypothetical protein
VAPPMRLACIVSTFPFADFMDADIDQIKRAPRRIKSDSIRWPSQRLHRIKRLPPQVGVAAVPSSSKSRRRDHKTKRFLRPPSTATLAAS